MSLPRLHQLLPFAQIFLLFVPLLQWLSLACVLQALLHRLPLPQGLGLLAVSNSLPFPQCFPSASRILTFPPPTPTCREYHGGVSLPHHHSVSLQMGNLLPQMDVLHSQLSASLPRTRGPRTASRVISLSTLDSFSVCPL